MLYIFAVIFVAITNFYYVGINHSVDFYYYIVLYNITIVSYGYQRKLKYIYIYIYHFKETRGKQLSRTFKTSRAAYELGHSTRNVKVVGIRVVNWGT